MAGDAFPYLIPASDLEMVRNCSGLAHFVAQKMAPRRIFRDVLVVRGTFELDEGRLRFAKVQEPVRLADRYVPGRPASRSSLLLAGDLHLDKPGADVVMMGHARPAAGRATARWACSVALADRGRALARLTLEALGPRVYLPSRVGAKHLSDAAATTAVPIRYELAFGGAFTRRDGSVEVHRENPSGVGFVDDRELDEDAPLPGPQWQLAGAPLTRLNEVGALAGFGPVPRSWASRAKFAGSYDAAWRAQADRDEQARLVPDYAPDFSPAFFQCAHPALRTERPLRGDERLVLHGLIADAPELTVELPGLGMIAEVYPRATRVRRERMTLDTVDVDLDTMRVGLVWRLTLDPRERIGSTILYTDDLLEDAA